MVIRRLLVCFAVGLSLCSLVLSSSRSSPRKSSSHAVRVTAAAAAQPSPSPRTKINYTIPGRIPVIKQPNTMGCWATVATMLLSWRDNTTYEIEEVLKKAGPRYLDVFRANQGLDVSDKKPFLQAMGLRSENPQSFSEKGWLSLLQDYGPVWVTSHWRRNQQEKEKFSVHARILVGMYEDDRGERQVKIIDPETGSQYDETLGDFVRRYENIAREDLVMGTEFQPQVIHF